jgi:glucose-1-phosphate cytidylyltransferase
MKALILAGGMGTRLAEETSIRPKPMVEIGGRPILWHIMKNYSTYGINEFILLLGYKGYYIKEYFANYFMHQSDVTINLENNDIQVHNNSSEPWKITLLDTGSNTMTGGRVLRAKEFIKNEPFMLTYGDGVGNINIDSLMSFHKNHGKMLTMTSVQPDGRFGTFEENGSGIVTKFLEKPKGDGSWINGGFFIAEPSLFDYILDGDKTVFEQQPMQKLAEKGELMTYRHDGFWKCMDTLRDKNELNDMWASNEAPWKIW